MGWDLSSSWTAFSQAFTVNWFRLTYARPHDPKRMTAEKNRGLGTRQGWDGLGCDEMGWWHGEMRYYRMGWDDRIVRYDGMVWDEMGWQLLSQGFSLREKRPGYEDGELASERKSSLANQTRGKRQPSIICITHRKEKYKIDTGVALWKMMLKVTNSEFTYDKHKLVHCRPSVLLDKTVPLSSLYFR